MDARSSSAPRSVTEGPSVRSTGGGSGDRTLGDALVKKWRKRLTEGDAHDSQVLCSRSRTHHTPYFRWDVRVTKRIVEMRVSPPENLKRVPGPRALLYYLPRDAELQAA